MRCSKKVMLSLMSLPVLAALAFMAMPSFLAQEYARFSSPDGRHTLIVFRRPLWFAMPGGSGDAPGYVILVSTDGKVLQRRAVEMVQLIETPEWTADRVSVKLILDWPR